MLSRLLEIEIENDTYSSALCYKYHLQCIRYFFDLFVG